MFTLTGDTNFVIKTKNIRNTKITFQSIQFNEGSDEVLPSMYEDLENVINFMIDNPKFKLNISGHTDMRGDKKNNQRLSQARANSIKAYICEGGVIKPWKVEAMGFGDTRPIVPDEKTDIDREKNRRVEFELVMPKPQ
jgi:outer membrane protein OmpA-like peptidoglycan-associated protein